MSRHLILGVAIPAAVFSTFWLIDAAIERSARRADASLPDSAEFILPRVWAVIWMLFTGGMAALAIWICDALGIALFSTLAAGAGFAACLAWRVRARIDSEHVVYFDGLKEIRRRRSSILGVELRYIVIHVRCANPKESFAIPAGFRRTGLLLAMLRKQVSLKLD